MKTQISSLRHLFVLMLLIIFLPWFAASIQSNLVERDRLMRGAADQSLVFLDHLDPMERLDLGGTLKTIEMLLLRGGGHEHLELLMPQTLAEAVGPELPIAIMDFRGNVLASSLPLVDPEAIGRNPQVGDALRTGKISFGASKGIFGPGRDGLILAYPVVRSGCATDSVIVAFIDEERFIEPLRSLELPPGAAVEVSDLEGNAVARYFEPEVDVVEGEARRAGVLLETPVDKGSHSTFQRSSDGSTRLVASRIIGDAHGTPVLCVTLTAPASSTLSRINTIAFGNLVALLAVAAIVTPIVWRIVHAEVVRPVERLASLASRIEQGELDVRHGGPYGGGELGLLARTFDGMSTALKRRARELTHISHYDSLTGAHNRTYVESAKEELDSEDKLPTTVIVGDINGLKRVNDTYGHSVGDEMIRAAGNIMRRCVGERGIVARWDGDEFVVILPKTDWKEGLQICRKIRDGCSFMEPDPASPSIA